MTLRVGWIPAGAALVILTHTSALGQPGPSARVLDPGAVANRVLQNLRQRGVLGQGRLYGWGGAFWFGPQAGRGPSLWYAPRVPRLWLRRMPVPAPGMWPRVPLAKLGLTEGQRKELAEILASAVRDRVMLMTDPNLKPNERLAKLAEIRRNVRRRIEALLTPEQKQKLRTPAPKGAPPAKPRPQRSKGRPA